MRSASAQSILAAVERSVRRASREELLAAEVSVPLLNRDDVANLESLVQVRLRDPYAHESRLLFVDASRLRFAGA